MSRFAEPIKPWSWQHSRNTESESQHERRVTVTAFSGRTAFSYIQVKERSRIRWQHRLKREHPTCTERETLT
jgi:hypothetical protein